MSRPLRIQFEDAVYHATSRGNDRRDIVRDDDDRGAWLAALEESADRYGVELLAWCLMNNHFHLLVATPRANLAEFMRRFKIVCTQILNHRQRRSGHLFQGRYTAVLVERDTSLTAVSRYIHLNPIRTRAMARRTLKERLAALAVYPWSSLPGTLDPTKRLPFLKPEAVLAPYGGDTPDNRKRYWKDLVDDYTENRRAPEEAAPGVAVGSPAFVEEMSKKIAGLDVKGMPAARRLRAVVETDRVIDAVASVLETDRAALLTRRGRDRHVLAEALSRHAGLLNSEIARLVGLSESAVSVGRTRLRAASADSPALRDILERIDDVCRIDP